MINLNTYSTNNGRSNVIEGEIVNKSVYLPLFSINTTRVSNNIEKYYLSDYLNKNNINSKIENKFILKYIDSPDWRINNKISFKDYINNTKYTINTHYIQKNIRYNLSKFQDNLSYGGSNYELLNSNILNSNYWLCIELRANKYITNLYYLGIYNNDNSVNTLFTLVVKPEYVKVVKLLTVLDRPIEPEMLEFWVKEGFDHKDTSYKNLRVQYRKVIKAKILEYGIPIIEKSNFDEVFPVIRVPEVKTVSAYNSWLSDKGTEFMKAKRIELGIDKKRIFTTRRKPKIINTKSVKVGGSGIQVPMSLQW